MTPKYICHKDFAHIKPVCVFHKECENIDLSEKNDRYLNRHILFRKRFDLDKTKNARLRITADDYYKLYVNGVFVTAGPAASYPHCYNYNEIDLSAYLCEGENLIAVHTYYQGLINRVWVSGDRRQMLWLELWVDGEQALVSDTSWKCHDHTGYGVCGKIGYETQFMEIYDSNAPEARFYLKEFDDTLWENASIFENADYTLVAQSTAQLLFYEVEPKLCERRGDTLYLDFGREMVGYLSAHAKGNKGDTVILRYGEELCDDGSVRYNMRCNCLYEEKWNLSGKHDVLNQFDYKAFRYAEIIIPHDAEVTNITMAVRHYPYEQKAEFDADTPELSAIIKLCADTIKYGMQENFVDCPTREKGQYLGDVSIAARAHAILTDDTSMMKKAIVDFCNSCFICDGMMAVSTSSLMQEIADYSLQFPAQALWVYRTDGDIDFLRRVEPYISGMYRYFLKYVRNDGLLENLFDKWNMVDWPKNLRDGYDFPLTRPVGEGLHNVLNGFWCGFLQSLDEIYSVLGMGKTGITDKVIGSYTDTFYCEKTGLFCDTPMHTHSSIHSNVLPLLFNIGSEECHKNIIDLIKKKGLSSMGVYMAYFTLAALKVRGEYDLAKQLIADPACWQNMLAEGATTTFEAWGMDQKWNTSLFHPWATAPVIILSKNALPY